MLLDLKELTSCYFFRLGVELLRQYKLEMEKIELERQELANAEKLFDLPITTYHELLQVQKELKGLEQIFAIYEEQKVEFHWISVWLLLLVLKY